MAILLAQAPSLPQPPVTAPSNINNISQFLSSATVCTIINWVFWFIIIFAIIFTLVAAFRYLTAAGDPEKVKRAGATLLYVVIAVVVALIAKGLPLLVSSFVGGGLTSVGC